MNLRCLKKSKDDIKRKKIVSTIMYKDDAGGRIGKKARKIIECRI